MTNIKLFPLSSVVLPNGKMKLRIFESRYKRLVSECCQSGEGFGVCLVNNEAADAPHNVSMVGTLASIVDFELLDDGLLGVTIEGKQRFTIERVWSEFDGLRSAEVNFLEEWAATPLAYDKRYLGEQLERVYQEFPNIQSFYPDARFDDASWIAQRWLEILPLRSSVFDQLVMPKDCGEALQFLSEAIDTSSLGRAE